MIQALIVKILQQIRNDQYLLETAYVNMSNDQENCHQISQHAPVSLLDYILR